MKNQSIWLQEIKEKEYPTLEKDMDVDILIIGGGITGVSLLYELRNEKKKVVLLEAKKIGHGVTSKSTAKINYLQGIVYSKIKKFVGEKEASDYLQSQLLAIQKIKEIIKREKIDCDFEKVCSRVYSNGKDLEEEYEFLKENKVIVFQGKNYIEGKDTYVFHPLKYVQALAEVASQKKEIYENTKIKEIQYQDGIYVCKGNHTIRARQVVLACHYPFELFPFFLPVRTTIEKSYVMAKLLPFSKQETFITTKNPIFSKRYYNNSKEAYEILLSGSHNICYHLNVEKNFQSFLGDVHPDFAWSNEDIMTSDFLPFIGKIGPDLFLATGYNTWGMTNGVFASSLLKDLLQKKENLFEDTFAPYRQMNFAKWKQYPINILSNTMGMVPNKIWKRKSWYPDSIRFFVQNGKSLATVKDGNISYTVETTCPHMGCTLIYNSTEKTWECPCHASKFSIDGIWLKGPSKKDITYSLKNETEE